MINIPNGLILLYVSLFCLLIYFAPLFKSKAISRTVAVSLFLTRVVAGLLYGFVHNHFYKGGDVSLLYRDSEIIYSALIENPLHYLELVFGMNNYKPFPKHLLTYIESMGHWGNTEKYMIVRVHAIVQLFSFGNYYVHYVFSSFISFCGSWMLFKGLQRLSLISYKKLLFFLFLFPSFIFWTSGLHKETLVLFSLGAIINGSSLIIQKNKMHYLALLIVSFCLLYICRKYIFFLLIIPYFFFSIWQLVIYYPTQKRLILTLSISIFLVGMALGLIYLQPFTLLLFKQSQFMTLEGNSNIYLPVLDTSLSTWLKAFPYALFNTFILPFPSAQHSLLLNINALENIFIYGFIAYSLYQSQKNLFNKPINLVLFLFPILLYLTIGYIVPNLGAISRYKSIATPLFLLVLSTLKKTD